MKGLFSLLFIFSLCRLSYAQNYVIPHPYVQSVYVTGPETNQVIYGPFGTGPANWNIAQWTSPGPITNTSSPLPPPGPCHDPYTSWYLATENARVCVSENNNTNVVELAQSSKGLKCGDEYDLFLSPNDGYGGMNTNWITTPPLGSLNYLNISFAAQLLYLNVESLCGSFPECSGSPDYSYGTAAIILGAPGETLFYQLVLYESRGMNAPWKCPQFQSACEQGSGWFFSTNPYGVDEHIGNFGQPCLDDYQLHYYNIDLLPHLQKFITSGPVQNKNWKDWTVGSGYIGIGGNGLYQATMTVSGFQLIHG